MAEYDCDLFVIGGGSGGVRAARLSAAYGAKTILAEEKYLGGTCVNVGCVPKKLFSYAAHFADDFADAAGFGWNVPKPSFDWKKLLANKNAEIARLNGIYRKVLEGAGVTVLDARATLLDAHTVAVGGRNVTAKYILVATGGWPAMPKFPGVEHAVSSNEVFFLEEFPERAVIMGGGYIAVEFAGIFNGLGARTTQLYRGPLFLRGFDDDLRDALAREMRAKGVDLRFDADIARIDRSGRELVVTLKNGGTIAADLVMIATGRAPNAANLGLDKAGVKLDDKGAVVVDLYSRTNVENIYAVGDVTDRINLTPVAIHEGQCFAETVFGGAPRRPDHDDVPSAVFSNPNMASVGLTEAAARKKHGAVDIYRTRFRALKHTLSGRDEKTLMKLVVDRASQRVLGCHMLGADAGELIQGLAIAVKMKATKAEFDATLPIHPTSAEEFVTLRTKSPDPAAEAAE